MSELRFGVGVPVFANPGPAFLRTPGWASLDPVAAIDSAVAAERLGEARHAGWLDAIASHGRKSADLELSLEIQVLVGPTDADVKRIARDIVGTPDEVVGQIQEYQAEHVMPALRDAA